MFHKHAIQLLNMFELINKGHVPRCANNLAALANIVANWAVGPDETMSISICNRWVLPPLEEDDEPLNQRT